MGLDAAIAQATGQEFSLGDALKSFGIGTGAALVGAGAVVKAKKAAKLAETTGGGDIPARIFRGATQGNPNHVKLRPGEKTVSFRDSLSNPVPEPGSPPQAVLRPGRNFIEVDTSKLPPGSVIVDGGTNGLPPGHVSVRASPEEIVRATVRGGKFPK